MNEQQIEAQVERMIDALDREYINTEMTLTEYGVKLKAINRWADNNVETV